MLIFVPSRCFSQNCLLECLCPRRYIVMGMVQQHKYTLRHSDLMKMYCKNSSNKLVLNSAGMNLEGAMGKNALFLSKWPLHLSYNVRDRASCFCMTVCIETANNIPDIEPFLHIIQ